MPPTHNEAGVSLGGVVGTLALPILECHRVQGEAGEFLGGAQEWVGVQTLSLLHVPPVPKTAPGTGTPLEHPLGDRDTPGAPSWGQGHPQLMFLRARTPLEHPLGDKDTLRPPS